MTKNFKFCNISIKVSLYTVHMFFLPAKLAKDAGNEVLSY